MIKLLWKAIKRDVDRVTFATAKVRMSDASPEVVDTAQTDDSQTSERMVKRWAEEGISALIGLPYGIFERGPETPEPNSDNDDLLHHDVSEWTFNLNSSNSTINPAAEKDQRTIAILMHQFVVAYILWQWSVSCMPELVGEMETKFQFTRKGIESAMHQLAMPVKARPYKTNMNPIVITVD